MKNSKISFTFLLSVFTNQIVCDLLNKKDGDPKSKSEDIYQKKNIDRTIIVRPLPPPFTLPPFLRPQQQLQPPIILTLGVPNGLPNLGFNPYEIDYFKNLRLPFQKNQPLLNNPGFGAGLDPGILGLFQNIDNFADIQSPNVELSGGKHEHYINFMDLKQGNPNQGAPVQYFLPQTDQIGTMSGEVINQKPANLGMLTGEPHIEILKSLGYTLPSEITFNHPVSYAKDYLLDAATSNSIKNVHKQAPRYKNSDLLTGEEEAFMNSEKDEILTEVESVKKETLNKMETISTNFPNQYYVSNRKPITFDSDSNKPKNIYEIISAEKITPKEVDMTEDDLKILKNKENNNNETNEIIDLNLNKNSDETVQSLEIKENENTIDVLAGDRKWNSTTTEQDSDLRVLELGEVEDQVLLLLPQENVATLKKSPKKRSTNDSFHVNIGAGYGVGIDQNTPYLPESTTQINSTNPLTNILKNEHIIIGKYPGKLPKFDSESRKLPFQIESKKTIMNMKEIQKIVHNFDENSEFSKVVQVVKVPAVYEIHLEKVEKNHQHAPKQYIQQINNLAKRPKNKILIKGKQQNKMVYGKKSKDLVKIDDWQKNNQNRNRKNKQTILSHKNTYFNRPNPIQDGSVKPNFREKKNTNFVKNHQNLYRPEYTPYYSPVQQTHSAYSTLTRKVPFAVRRKMTEGSGVQNDLVYGSNKEKVQHPEEINITIQPGTTMVTVPKLDNSKERNFIEDKSCKNEFSQPEILRPPEIMSESTNINNVYFTTLTPIQKEKEISDRSRLGYFKTADRRNGIRPIKYIMFINKIVTDQW